MRRIRKERRLFKILHGRGENCRVVFDKELFARKLTYIERMSLDKSVVVYNVKNLLEMEWNTVMRELADYDLTCRRFDMRRVIIMDENF